MGFDVGNGVELFYVCLYVLKLHGKISHSVFIYPLNYDDVLRFCSGCDFNYTGKLTSCDSRLTVYFYVLSDFPLWLWWAESRLCNELYAYGTRLSG